MVARDVLPVEIFSIVAFSTCNVSPQYPEISCLIIPCGWLFRNKMQIYISFNYLYVPLSHGRIRLKLNLHLIQPYTTL